MQRMQRPSMVDVDIDDVENLYKQIKRLGMQRQASCLPSSHGCLLGVVHGVPFA